jgi:DNA-directed RNA polymerase specialized sigma24 family protein
MTRKQDVNTESTETETTDELLSAEEFANMGWPADSVGVESGADRIETIASSLAVTGIVGSDEARAFAFHEIAGVDLQRTADETGMSTTEVEQALRSAERKVSRGREFVELLENCNC